MRASNPRSVLIAPAQGLVLPAEAREQQQVEPVLAVLVPAVLVPAVPVRAILVLAEQQAEQQQVPVVPAVLAVLTVALAVASHPPAPYYTPPNPATDPQHVHQ